MLAPSWWRGRFCFAKPLAPPAKDSLRSSFASGGLSRLRRSILALCARGLFLTDRVKPSLWQRLNLPWRRPCWREGGIGSKWIDQLLVQSKDRRKQQTKGELAVSPPVPSKVKALVMNFLTGKPQFCVTLEFGSTAWLGDFTIWPNISVTQNWAWTLFRQENSVSP